MTDEATSIFLTADSPQAVAVRDTVGTWTAAGLLQPSLWTALSDWRDGELDLPAPMAYALERGTADDDGVVDLQAAEGLELALALGRRRHRLVRLIVLNLLPRPDAADEALTKRARDMADFVRRCLSGATGTDFVRINLLVPATNVQAVDCSMLLPGWDSNVVASPEDHLSPRHPNLYVRGSDNFVAHAALQAVTVAGLWHGVEHGPFDAGSAPSAGQAPDPVVVRCFARVVTAPSTVDAVAERALVSRARWPLPTTDAPVMAAADPEALVERLVVDCQRVEGGALLFHPFPGMEKPQQREIGLRAALRLLIQHVGAALRGAPRRLVVLTESKVRDKATAVVRAVTGLGEHSELLPTYGAGGGAGVGKGRSPFVEAVTDDIERLGELLHAAGLPMPVVAPTPELWGQLRAAVFALVDGGEMPPAFTEPVVSGQREVVTDPSLLAPDPASDPLVVATGADGTRTVTRFDPRAFLVTRQSTAADTSSPAGDGPGDETTGPVPTTSPAEDADAPSDAWLHEHRRSFTWRLGHQMSLQLDAATAAAQAALAIVREGPPEADAAAFERLRLRWKRFWMVACGVGAVAFVAAVVLGVRDIVADRPAAATATVVAVVAAVVVLCGFLQYCRETFAALHRLEQAHTAYENAYHSLCAALWETDRLSSLYRQYTGWAETVGWNLHHPWGRATCPSPASAGSLEECRPAAFGYATGTPPDELLDRIEAEFDQVLFTRSWLSSAYARAEERAMHRYRRRYGLGDDAIVRPDGDTPRSDTGARQWLLQEFRGGHVQAEGRDDVGNRLSRFCSGKAPSELLDQVTPQAGTTGVPTGPVDVAQFLASALPPEPGRTFERGIFAAQDGHQVTRVDAWGPATILAESHLDGTGIADRIPVRAESGAPLLMVATSIERSDPLAPAALSLFDATAVKPDRKTRWESVEGGRHSRMQ